MEKEEGEHFGFVVFKDLLGGDKKTIKGIVEEEGEFVKVKTHGSNYRVHKDYVLFMKVKKESEGNGRNDRTH